MTRATARPAAARPAAAAGAAGAAAPAAAHRGDCHYCGSVLPRGRAVTFCPYCGQDVTVRQCPACSAELDVGWQFCISCGRGVGAT